jgi:hypothetical protein
LSLETILIGGALALIGIAFTFAGYPLFLILLPLWAFMWGLIGGGGAVAQALGNGLFADAVGIGIGIVLGILAALVALAFWWAGIILLGASLGYYVGSGLVTAIGINPGLLSLIVGLVGAAIVGSVFVIYRAPRIAVVIITAFLGGAAAVAGVLVFFGTIPADSLRTGVIETIREQGPISILVALALGLVGSAFQYQFSRNTEVRYWRRFIGEGDEA